MHRIFYFPETDDPLTAASRASCYSNFHGCFFAQFGDLKRARQHLALGNDQATIFHLTADEAVYRGADTKEVRDRCQRFLNALEAFVSAGGRFVWSIETEPTVSTLPAGLAADFRAGLGALAHLVHCSSFSMATAIRSVFDLDWRKLVVVPCGSYLPLYGDENAMPVEELRAELGLAQDQRLLVHFGSSDPAYGTDRLLQYWREKAIEGSSLVLLGALADAFRPNDAAKLRAVGVDLKPGLATIRDLARWVMAADLVLLPFERFCGSAELMLALSCGRPTLIPAFSPLMELITPGREALTYDVEGGDAAFAACLNEALELDQSRLRTMGAEAAKRAESLTWRMLGRQLADSFLRITAGGLPVIPTLEPAATAPGAIKPRLVS